MPTKKPGFKGRPTTGVERVIPNPQKRVGRQSLFMAEHVEKAFKLCLLGLTDEELADMFDIQQSTLYTWQKDHPELKDAMWRGRDGADQAVVDALYHRAKGYSHPEDDIKAVAMGGNAGSEIVITRTTRHYPPDTAAAFIWLKNRQKGRWRNDPHAASGTNDPNEAARAARAAIAAADSTIDEEGNPK